MSDPRTRLTETYRRLVQGTNINGQSLLATDYLNHFNEVVMMLEMVADMPEMIEEVKAWRPKTYVEHFAESGFSDKELAIHAYENAPLEYVEPFDRIVAEVDSLIPAAVEEIEAKLAKAAAPAGAGGNGEALRLLVDDRVSAIRGQLERAGGIINGALEHVTPEAEPPQRMSQDEVDRLFD